MEDFMKNSLLLSAATLVFLSAAAFADPADQPGHASPAPNTQNATVSAVKDATSAAVGTVTAEMTSMLPAFTDDAANIDMYEIEAAKIAEDRSKNPEIKDFAAKMIDAHTQSSAELKAILVQIKSDVTPPAHLDDRRQGLIDDLRGAKDADFDARYVSQQVDAHREALLLMQGYSARGDVPAVKKFTDKTTPVVQQHLDMAELIYKKLNLHS
jgi:putative membrane protein